MAGSDLPPVTCEDFERMEHHPTLDDVPRLVAEVRRSWAEGVQCLRDLHYACTAGSEQRQRAEAAEAEAAQYRDRLKAMPLQPDTSAIKGAED